MQTRGGRDPQPGLPEGRHQKHRTLKIRAASFFEEIWLSPSFFTYCPHSKIRMTLKQTAPEVQGMSLTDEKDSQPFGGVTRGKISRNGGGRVRISKIKGEKTDDAEERQSLLYWEGQAGVAGSVPPSAQPSPARPAPGGAIRAGSGGTGRVGCLGSGRASSVASAGSVAMQSAVFLAVRHGGRMERGGRRRTEPEEADKGRMKRTM